MSKHDYLCAELRLLYEYGEATTFDKDAQRILEGLAVFPEEPRTLTDALHLAGAEITTVTIEQKPDAD